MIKKCALFTAHLRSWSLKSLRMRIHWVAWNDVIELVLLNFERRQYLDLWRQDKKKFARNSHAVTINGAKNVHCTECKRRCLSKNTCYLSIILVNNHNQWAWNLNCCSYLNMCVCVWFTFLWNSMHLSMKCRKMAWGRFCIWRKFIVRRTRQVNHHLWSTQFVSCTAE